MRLRTILLIAFILLIAAFVTLNWSEFMQPTELSLGFAIFQAPLGLVMVGLLVVSLLVFMLASAYQQTAYLLESRKFSKEINAQRELADKAEASRFTELRQALEQMNQNALQREAAHEASLRQELQRQTELILSRIDSSGNTLAAYIGEVDDRMQGRGNVA
ncbi:hypothetical protein [Variovorax sp. HJSM1_2]|uniref:hypothetical protein n=1 Tax=Variovorax sp. HJSM1_2 TaxID=3366263 RepID=UPI003BB9E0D5